MNNLDNTTIFGLALVILGSVLLGNFLGRASNELTLNYYTIKMTCFGKCQISKEFAEDASRFVNVERMQQENYDRRLRAEFFRQAKKD